MSKFGDWFFGRDLEPKIEVRQGSVGSAGGDSPLKGIMPPARGIGTEITVSQALSLAPVWRAISILCTAISQLPMLVMRGGQEIEISSENSNLWMRHPEIGEPCVCFLQKTVFSLATRGNCYWRMYGMESPGDQTNGLEVLNPTAMAIEYRDGKKVYVYNGYEKEKVFQNWQIKHLKLIEVFGSEYGVGPIQACSTELKGILDLRNYSHNIFETNTFPLTSISVPDIIDGEQAKEYQQAFLRMTENGLPAVFGNGGKIENNTFNPKDAQFIENQQFSITQVARIFGIPASKLLAAVDGTSMTYTNLIDENAAFIQDSLMQYMKIIEESLSWMLPRGQTVKLDVKALLRASTDKRYAAYSVALDKGFMTINEVRAQENLPPLVSGDEVIQTPKVVPTGMGM